MPDPSLVIRASEFYWLLRCPRRLWLDRHGDPDQRVSPSVKAEARLDHGLAHEAAILAAADGTVTAIPADGWEDAVRLTRELMAQGVGVIQQACLEASMQIGDRAITILGRVDRLQRSRRSGYYMPIEIKAHHAVSPADRLQMDCYCWLLGQMQAYMPDGEFWLGDSGDGLPGAVMLHEYDEARLLNHLGAFASALANREHPPEAVMRRHCAECMWKARCPSLPNTDHDITLLPRLTEKTFEHLRREGLTSLAQIAALSADDLRRFRGIKSTAESLHAHARAFVENRPVWLREPPPLPDTAYFFDIETVPYTNQVWAIGWGAAGDFTHVGMVAPGLGGRSRFLSDDLEVMFVDSPDALWRLLAERVPAHAPQLFHWSGFDAGNMRQTAPLDTRRALEQRLVDLMAVYQKQVRLPVTSDSLKEVAPYFGFRWAAYADYAQAYSDYRHWLASGADRSLANAAMYQADDVKAMRVIWRCLRGAR